MKAIMVTYDSLNRHFLPAYGNGWVKTPNFDRLAERCVVFDKSYVGSLPCMPARRELHTGRHNFLHRSWGPMEPFDDSMPELLKQNGIYSHLTSDHGHYWEDGGCTYHTRYSSWECERGQEGDPWKGVVGDVEIPEHLGQSWRQDVVNRTYLQSEDVQPQTLTFKNGVEFIDKNYGADQWFLHVETFDPHEPFYAMPQYRELYEKAAEYDGPLFDWPPYRQVSDEERSYVEHVRNMYAALVTMCDRNLGKILDRMDAYDLWEDTLLIVNTDHGFFLGGHDWWAKTNSVNLLEEVAHTPLFIWDPRCRRQGRCDCLVQTIDLAPTVLEFFGLPISKDMLGKPLRDAIAENKPVRTTGIYGAHGAQIACTDGGYTYILAPGEVNKPLYNYTLMTTHMRCRYPVEELQNATMAPPFSFTKGCPLVKTEDYNYFMGHVPDGSHNFKTALYDLAGDPHQEKPCQNEEKEAYFRKEIIRHMKENDAPAEQYIRMGLTEAGNKN